MTTGGGGVHPGDPWHPDWRPGAEDEPDETTESQETGTSADETIEESADSSSADGSSGDSDPTASDPAVSEPAFDPDSHLEVSVSAEPTDEFPDFSFDLDEEAGAEDSVPELESVEPQAEPAEPEAVESEIVEPVAPDLDPASELPASKDPAPELEVVGTETPEADADLQETVSFEPVTTAETVITFSADDPVEVSGSVESSLIEPELVEPEMLKPESVEPESVEVPADESVADEPEPVEPESDEKVAEEAELAKAATDEEVAGDVADETADDAADDAADDGARPDELAALEDDNPLEAAEDASGAQRWDVGSGTADLDDEAADLGYTEVIPAVEPAVDIDHDADTAEVPIVSAEAAPATQDSVSTEPESKTGDPVDVSALQEPSAFDVDDVSDVEDAAWAEFMADEASDLTVEEEMDLTVDEVDIHELQDDTAEHEFLVEDAEAPTSAQPGLFGDVLSDSVESEVLDEDQAASFGGMARGEEAADPKAVDQVADLSTDSELPDEPVEAPLVTNREEFDVSAFRETAEDTKSEEEVIAAALQETGDQPKLAEVETKVEAEPTPELELVDSLTADIAPLEFEAFTNHELTEERYTPVPTQEHVGLAAAIAAAESSEIEAEAMSAPLDGVDTGIVGVDEIAEDESFFLDDPEDDRDLDHDRDAPAPEERHEPSSGSSELTLRIATGVLLVSVFGLSLSLGGVAFLVFIGAVALIALTEFMDVSTESGYRPLRLFAWLGAIGILVGTYTNGPAAIPAGLAATAAVILAWFGSRSEPPQEPYVSSVVTLFGVAWIPALLSLVLPIAESPDRIGLVVSLMLIVAAFDVGSYFVGRALGKRKLAPEISPNKSVEGLVGGVLLSLLMALITSIFVEPITALIAVYLAIGVSVAAPLGDLSESLVKRHFGVKDMGSILPGHGGLLDRIDGYLFAIPTAYLILTWTGVL